MVYVAIGHMRDDNFAIGQRAGVPSLLLVRVRGFLLCYCSGCGGSYFAIGQDAGVPSLLLVRVLGFLLCYWPGSRGSYFAIGQGAGVPTLLLIRDQGAGVPSLLLVMVRGSFFAIGQMAGGLLCSWSGSDGSQACNSGGSGVYMGRCPIGQGVGVGLQLVKVQGSICHWLASRS